MLGNVVSGGCGKGGPAGKKAWCDLHPPVSGAAGMGREKGGLTGYTLHDKVNAMDPNWATDHLQVIRTLMERAAVYRRALAPIMIYNGLLGSIAAGVGLAYRYSKPNEFVAYWTLVAVVGLAGSFLLVRKQAIRDREPFWSSPTRRVTQALLPPVIAGMILGMVVLAGARLHSEAGFVTIATLWLPAGWVVLYGCAFHAAGFFMPRGMKLFAWIFIVGGCAVFAIEFADPAPRPEYGHWVMGFFFGLLHLAYGVYLWFTEPRRNET